MFEPTNSNIPVYFKSKSTSTVVPAKVDWDSKSGVMGFTDDSELGKFSGEFGGKRDDLLINLMGHDYKYLASRKRKDEEKFKYGGFIQVDLASKKRPEKEDVLV
jgi:hypothetical protein